jgi:protease I
MGKVGVFLYEGFQEMEFWYPVLRLREVGADVVVIGVDGAAAAASVLGYPVVPNVALSATTPREYAALVIPGGNVGKLMENGAFRSFLRGAAETGVRIAAASQAASLAPGALVAESTDDVPQWTRSLLAEIAP